MRSLFIIALLVSTNLWAQNKEDNKDIVICDTYQEIYDYKFIAECPTLSVKGTDQKVASFIVSMLKDKSTLIEHNVTGNQFSERVLASLKELKANSRVYIENVILEDGTEAGFRRMKVNGLATSD